MTDPVRSAPAVHRAVDLLRALGAADGPRSLSELARSTGSAKSSTLAVLGALVAGGLVRRSGDGYALASATLELGSRYLAGIPAVRSFERACIRIPSLRDRLVRLATLEGTEIVYLARHEGRGPDGGARVGDRLPAASTAMGRVLLAGFSDAAVRGRLESPTAFARLTGRSTSDAASLIRKLHDVRRQGFAVEVGEVRPGVVGLGVGLSLARDGGPRLAVGVATTGWTPAAVDVDMIEGLTELAADLARGDDENADASTVQRAERPLSVA